MTNQDRRKILRALGMMSAVELWRSMGFETLEGFVTGFWEKRYGRRDANNLYSMNSHHASLES
jgi:hypothetical protein